MKKLYAEDGKTELGRLIGKNIVELKLDNGNTIQIVGEDYTLLGRGESEISVVCTDGEIDADSLPKEVEDGEENEEEIEGGEGKSQGDDEGDDEGENGSESEEDRGGDDEGGEGNGSESENEEQGDDGEDKEKQKKKRKYTRL